METKSQLTEKSGKLKPCCACPETKKLRDECIFNKSEELCFEEINKHLECLRSKGFTVELGTKI